MLADMVIVDQNPLQNFKVLYGNGAVRLNDETGRPERVGGIKYTIKDGIVYDAKKLMDDVAAMVAKQKSSARRQVVNFCHVRPSTASRFALWRVNSSRARWLSRSSRPFPAPERRKRRRLSGLRRIDSGSAWRCLAATNGGRLMRETARANGCSTIGALPSSSASNRSAPTRALTLPFADPASGFIVKYDGSNAALQEGALAIEFSLDDERWRCELQGEWDWGRTPPSDYYCASTEEPAAPASGAGPVRSPDGKWEALIQNNNVAVRQSGGAVRMLSADGTPAAPYHLGSLRWSGDSRTLSGYRVHSDAWRSAPSAGSVKTLISTQEWVVARD